MLVGKTTKPNLYRKLLSKYVLLLKAENKRTGYPNYVWAMVLGFGLGVALLLAGEPAFRMLLRGHSLNETEPGVYHGHPVLIPYRTYFEVACMSPLGFIVGIIGWLSYTGFLDRFIVSNSKHFK